MPNIASPYLKTANRELDAELIDQATSCVQIFCTRCTSRTPGTLRRFCTSLFKCRTSTVSTTKSTTIVPSGVGLVSTLRILVPSSAMIAVNSFSNPARSSQITVSFTGYVCGFAVPGSVGEGDHSTWIRRSDSYNRFCTFGQLRACTATPLPRVTYPTISSPRIGLQQRARYTSRSSCPSTCSDSEPFPKNTRFTASDICPSVLPIPPSGGVGSAVIVEPGSSLLSTCRAENFPNPTPARSSACVPSP